MEVTALCIRLLMTVLLLLAAHVDFSYSQKADAAFPQVVPNRQQHFEYESIVVSCEGLHGETGWRVMRNIKGVSQTCAPIWDLSIGPCKITTAFPTTDNGEYWCEMGRKRSDTVNITVTAGSVILESPVLSVMEGDNVTLTCKEKKTSSNIIAEFFKDGFLMEKSPTGDLTLHSVAKSIEGLYKCSISGAGESPESWLVVRARDEPDPSSHHAPQLSLLLSIGVSVFLVALLLLVGLLQCRKRQTTITGTATSPSSFQSSSSPQTVASYSVIPEPRKEKVETSVTDSMQATYAVVRKPRNEKDKDESLHIPVYHTLSLGDV